VALFGEYNGRNRRNVSDVNRADASLADGRDEVSFLGDHRLEGEQTLEVQVGTEEREADASRVEVEKIAVAAVFHNLGIWTNHTFDYIAPSVALARDHLAARGMAGWIPEIEAMIVNHHKITPSRANPHPSTIARGALSGVEGQSLVESFRRADWIDVTRGLRRFGLPRTFIAAVAATWPNAGFHRRLVMLTIDRFWKHPLTPLPMVKW
jgi:hypothetical protein